MGIILAAAGLALATALPATAAPVGPVQSQRVAGTAAMADWASEAELAPGEVSSVTVKALNLVATTHTPGGKPVTEALPSQVEVWWFGPERAACQSDGAQVAVASDLTTASGSFTCLAAVERWDPDTESMLPTGRTVQLSVTADWSSWSGISREQSRFRYSDGSTWSSDRGRTSLREASADLLITGPDGVIFQGAPSFAQILQTSGATLSKGDLPVALGGTPPQTAQSLAAAIEAYRVKGRLAEASWWSGDEDPQVWQPIVVSLAGMDAAARVGSGTGGPVQQPLQSFVAMALPLPGYPQAELWGLAEQAKFRIDSRLTRATLSFSCEAVVVVWDPVAGEEIVTGEIVPLSVQATWTGSGDLIRLQGRSSVSGEGFWLLQHRSELFRNAEALVRITGPAGDIFNGTMSDAALRRIAEAQLIRGAQEPGA